MVPFSSTDWESFGKMVTPALDFASGSGTLHEARTVKALGAWELSQDRLDRTPCCVVQVLSAER
eukprot:COSAG02_NODE_3387_length_6833_cov_54.669884_3_plen_64_part_00